MKILDFQVQPCKLYKLIYLISYHKIKYKDFLLENPFQANLKYHFLYSKIKKIKNKKIYAYYIYLYKYINTLIQ